MAHKLLDAKAAHAAVQAKQALEVMLAWEMVDIFNTPALLNPLRLAAYKAIDEMMFAALTDTNLADAKTDTRAALSPPSGPGNPPEAKIDPPKWEAGTTVLGKAVNDAIWANKGIMWTLTLVAPGKGTGAGGGTARAPVANVMTWHDLATLRAALKKDVDDKAFPGTFDCQACGDIIRLYTEFVEKAGAAAKGLTTDLVQEYAKLASAKELGKDQSIWNVLDKKTKKPVLGPDGKPWEFGRHRLMDPGQYKALLTPAKDGSFELTSVQEFLGTMGGGSSIWKLLDSSTIMRLDTAFGLVPSSDISGTTTDTIFYLGKFGLTKLDGIFSLLPLATIVAGAHHSVLEVALPLSQSGAMDYHIGSYTTLMPKSHQAGDSATAIQKVLQLAEGHKDNLRLLVWYDKGEIAGAYQFDPADKKEAAGWQTFSQATKCLAEFQKVDAKPAKSVVDALAKTITG